MYAEEYTDGVKHIAEAVDFMLGGGHDPGSGICYQNDVFEIRGFWSHADDDWSGRGQKNDFGFLHKSSGFKYSWYKRIGRSAEILSEGKPKTLEWYKIVVECLESVRDDPKLEWGCSLD